ncbi:MAG: alcohol dehydrogenase catalytic domain-containing protein [Actinomycetota bacterium]
MTGTAEDMNATRSLEGMRAFRKLGPGPGDAGVVSMSGRAPDPGEALIAVDACGICGSDLHAFNADPGYEWINIPVVLGHEFSGTVVATGSGPARLREGDHVVAMSIQGCGHCTICLSGSMQLCSDRKVIGLSYDGGLADYVVVPERYLIEVPAGLDLRSAALTEPLSVAVHAVADKARIVPGERVVVTGPGPIGMLCGLVAARSGAEVLMIGTPRDEERRLPLAESYGLRTSVTDEDGCATGIKEHFGSDAPEAWIDASGATAPLEEALQLIRSGGRIVVVGMYTASIDLPVTHAVRKEVSYDFSYASGPDDYPIALELLRSGAIDAGPMQDTFPLEQASDAFEAARSAGVAKATIVPSR